MTLVPFLVDTDWVIDHFNGVEAVTGAGKHSERVGSL